MSAWSLGEVVLAAHILLALQGLGPCSSSLDPEASAVEGRTGLASMCDIVWLQGRHDLTAMNRARAGLLRV